MTDTEKRYECAWHRRAEEAERERDEARAMVSAHEIAILAACEKLTDICDIEHGKSLLELCDAAEIEVNCEWEQRREIEKERDDLRAKLAAAEAALATRVDFAAANRELETIRRERQAESEQLRELAEKIGELAAERDSLAKEIASAKWALGVSSRTALLEAIAEDRRIYLRVISERDAALDALDRERVEHDETRGYRKHAEQERDDLRQSLALATAALELAEGREREVVERLKRYEAVVASARFIAGYMRGDAKSDLTLPLRTHVREHYPHLFGLIERCEQAIDALDAAPGAAETEPASSPSQCSGTCDECGRQCRLSPGHKNFLHDCCRDETCHRPHASGPAPDPHAGCVAAALEAASEAWERSGVEPFGQTLRELADELRRGG